MSLDIEHTINRWYDSPFLFATECIGVTPSSQQEDALRKFPHCKRMSIRSGHGTGKDAFASWLILWFIFTRPYPKIVCTAPTARQLSDILWAEIHKWARKSVISESIEHQKDKIFMKGAKAEWFAKAITASVTASVESQAETLAGIHGDHVLVVVDESSGVPDPVFVPLEGILTSDDNKVLLIGNPTKAMGYFDDTHTNKRLAAKWELLTWNSEESSNVTGDYIEYMSDKYGKDSNVYRVRVLGLPPVEGEDVLIPMAWAQACIDNPITVAEDELKSLGVDVARFGSDKTIIMPRLGNKIYPWTEMSKMNTMDVAEKVNNMMNDKEQNIAVAAIDEIGVGAGVVDWLTKHRIGKRDIFGVNVARKSTKLHESGEPKFASLRDELCWNVREKCEKFAYSFPFSRDDKMSEELVNEMCSIHYEFDKKGKIKVESKRDMKKKGLVSPNIFDALMLSEYFQSSTYNAAMKQMVLNPPKKRLQRRSVHHGRNAWQVA